MKKTIAIIVLSVTTLVSTTMWIITQQDFDDMQRLCNDKEIIIDNQADQIDRLINDL